MKAKDTYLQVDIVKEVEFGMNTIDMVQTYHMNQNEKSTYRKGVSETIQMLGSILDKDIPIINKRK